mmetsp:Transcript_5955/g.14304  ORF Transcript_5955/g.14304 Transcript_5955/m.14304 type:complete len:202 (-) Transcript_5955:1545-2150(-)
MSIRARLVSLPESILSSTVLPANSLAVNRFPSIGVPSAFITRTTGKRVESAVEDIDTQLLLIGTVRQLEVVPDRQGARVPDKVLSQEHCCCIVAGSITFTSPTDDVTVTRVDTVETFPVTAEDFVLSTTVHTRGCSNKYFSLKHAIPAVVVMSSVEARVETRNLYSPTLPLTENFTPSNLIKPDASLSFEIMFSSSLKGPG